ncbi:MAG: protein-tyrosine-phosphatase [Lachnospiraceae bacterium]|nr:protein-tyrosine-phosphatase [Lachnospiraceae bacterium]
MFGRSERREAPAFQKPKITDIHCHILPGVDDGSHSMNQSRRMLDLAWENGIRTIIATPHFMPEGPHPSVDRLERLAEELREYAYEQNYDMEIYTGNEIYYHQEAPELLEEGKILTLAGSSYVLVEFAPAEDARYIRNALAAIQAAGYDPVLAHVERYMNLCRKPYEQIRQLRDLGVLIQVNANAIEGKMGPQARKITGELLKRQWVDFVATDAHSDRGRSHAIGECLELLYRKYPAEYVENILWRNAQRLFLGK